MILMQAKQNMHDFNELVGLLFMLWILIVGIIMIRGKISHESEVRKKKASYLKVAF